MYLSDGKKNVLIHHTQHIECVTIVLQQFVAEKNSSRIASLGHEYTLESYMLQLLIYSFLNIYPDKTHYNLEADIRAY